MPVMRVQSAREKAVRALTRARPCSVAERRIELAQKRLAIRGRGGGKAFKILTGAQIGVELRAMFMEVHKGS